MSIAKPHVTHDPPIWRKKSSALDCLRPHFVTCHIFAKNKILRPGHVCSWLIRHTVLLPRPRIILALASVCAWLSTIQLSPTRKCKSSLVRPLFFFPWKILGMRHVSGFGPKKNPPLCACVESRCDIRVVESRKKSSAQGMCGNRVLHIYDFSVPPNVFFDNGFDRMTPALPPPSLTESSPLRL